MIPDTITIELTREDVEQVKTNISDPIFLAELQLKVYAKLRASENEEKRDES